MTTRMTREEEEAIRSRWRDGFQHHDDVRDLLVELAATRADLAECRAALGVPPNLPDAEGGPRD